MVPMSSGYVENVLLYAALPTLLTILGSGLIFLRMSIEERFIDSVMGFASGLMIYVAFLELLLPSLKQGGSLIAFSAFLSGFLMIKMLDILIPHTKIVRDDTIAGRSRKTILVASAIALHNIPEGLAVGSVAMLSSEEGLSVALAIGIQDFPEGYVVALSALIALGKVWMGFVIGVFSAISEYLAAIIALVGLINPDVFLPFLMMLSASAMIYVVVHEVAPEIFGHEHDEYATIGFIVGVLFGLLI